MEINQNKHPMPSNHLLLAIITAILCCLPAGIVSIIYASQVNTKYNAEDYEGAERASKNARIWWIVALILGLLIVVAIPLVVFLFAGDEFIEEFTKAYNQELEKSSQN